MVLFLCSCFLGVIIGEGDVCIAYDSLNGITFFLMQTKDMSSAKTNKAKELHFYITFKKSGGRQDLCVDIQ